jgi:hypothetical protein
LPQGQKRELDTRQKSLPIGGLRVAGRDFGFKINDKADNAAVQTGDSQDAHAALLDLAGDQRVSSDDQPAAAGLEAHAIIADESAETGGARGKIKQGQGQSAFAGA